MRARVVVTGGAGFVGSWLCERLLDRGAEVVCVDSFLTGTHRNLVGLRQREHFTLVEADVSEALDVEGPVAEVFHLASAASPVHYLDHPVETMLAGSEGTRHALELARRTGARFVLASTSEVYGDPEVHPQPEAYWGHVNPIGPRAVYDESKRYAEALTAAYRRTHGVDTAIARIFNTYGPRMRRDDGRAVPAFVSQALASEPLTVQGDGSQTRSLCFVDDTVEGLLRLAASGHPGPVNLGGTEEISVLQLAETIRDVVGTSSPVELVGAVEDDPQVRCPDTSLAREVLGWQAVTSLEEGLRRTLPWFATGMCPG